MGRRPCYCKEDAPIWVEYGDDIRNASPEFLKRLFGKAGLLYSDFARGIDTRPVEVDHIRKSVGCKHTLKRDVSLKMSVIIELYHVATDLVGHLEHSGFKGYTLTLKVKHNNFTIKTRSVMHPVPFDTLQSILPKAKELMRGIDYEHHPVRLIGLTVSNPHIDTGQWKQLELDFGDR